MKQPKYRYTTGLSSLVYKFTSIGPKGNVKKIVIYSPTQSPSIYNLAFGNYIECDDDLDDLTVSDNGDTQKVLATVVSTLQFFLKKHPKAWVFAKGSTKSRTRLYRMGISRSLAAILKNFVILGYVEMEGWESFALNRDYESFMITQK
ncbi:hypothetical protein SAMN04487996_101198 [Dyadobacter soli]|uniref:Uncharacterized protein n=1 Tax=Dyadobacter soli TaxID=659014 RepID=A0A1G6VC47_9BACT|nr:hypothetical protein [Dyadobacter soli]SDD50963.1 hypothetical protein SAMN04487996_101198 [Dyadobacter soli]